MQNNELYETDLTATVKQLRAVIKKETYQLFIDIQIVAVKVNLVVTSCVILFFIVLNIICNLSFAVLSFLLLELVFFALAGMAIFGFFFGLMLFIQDSRHLRKKRKVLKHALKNINLLSNYINEHKDYILYLSDFKAGSKSISFHGPPVGPTNIEFTIDGNHRLKAVSNALSKHIPIFFLNNIAETGYQYVGYPIIVSNSNWFSFYTTLLAHAKYVIIDYWFGFRTSENIKRELEHLIQYPNLVLFFVGTDEEYNELIKEYPVLRERIRDRFTMVGYTTNWLDKQEDSGYYTVPPDDPLFRKIKENRF